MSVCRNSLVLLTALLAGTVTSARESPRTVDGFPEVIDSGAVRIDTSAVRLKGIAAPPAQTPEGLQARGWLHRRIQGQRIYCHIDPGQTAVPPIGLCEIQGLDISALMVEAGVALDCPKESGGRYKPQQARAVAAGQKLEGRFSLPARCQTSKMPVKRGG
jgi:endonuclease YncB( thermonuclease family)